MFKIMKKILKIKWKIYKIKFILDFDKVFTYHSTNYLMISIVYSPFFVLGIPINEPWSQSNVAICYPHLVSSYANIPSDPLNIGYSFKSSIMFPLTWYIYDIFYTTVSEFIL